MSQQESQALKCLVAVKVRGNISAMRETQETLALLHLTHTNHAVILDDRPAFKGMLQRAQSYVTWGEASKETIAMMIKQRGKTGSSKITDEYAQKLGYANVDALVDAVFSCKAQYWKLEGVTPVFKLRPPKKGYKGTTKKSFRAGGEAGYRGEAINELVKRMV
jgi:large subunit ribosomal protein L30